MSRGVLGALLAGLLIAGCTLARPATPLPATPPVAATETPPSLIPLSALFANPASTTQRVNMTVRLSYDDAQTWPVAKSVFDGWSANGIDFSASDGDGLGACAHCQDDRERARDDDASDEPI